VRRDKGVDVVGLKYRRREGFPLLIPGLTVVICVLLVFELVIPRVIGSRLENAIASDVDSIESVRVRLRTFPVINLISSGSVNSMNIDCKGLCSNGLRIDTLMVRASGILIDMQALTEEGRLALSRIEQGRAEVVLTEDDLNRYVHGMENMPESIRIQLDPGIAKVTGSVNVAGIDINVSLDGTFLAKGDGSGIRYAIHNVQVGNTKLPSIITDGLISSLDFSLDMSDLPVPVIISEISVEDNVVRIVGRTPGDIEERG
jgi:hypothetical protein